MMIRENSDETLFSPSMSAKTNRIPGQKISHGAYSAFLPAPLPPALDWTPQLVRILSEADRLIGRLAGKTDPKTVQTLLRHSDVRLTLQFYTHAISDDRMSAAGATLGAILNGKDKSGLRADWRIRQSEVSSCQSTKTS